MLIILEGFPDGNSADSTVSHSGANKHARSPSSSLVCASASAKCDRVTGPVAVNHMADALSQMATSFNAGDVLIASPTHRTKAVRTVSADKTLMQHERVKAICLFTADIALCNSYLAINNQELGNDFLADFLDSN